MINMDKTNKYISGNEYSLRQLFDGDTKIVIPDLQRDYCWGNNALTTEGQPRELVTDFVKNIVELFKDKERKNTLGLIYGYEQPHSHIQICDGQQRLTTLFLLLGFINTQTNGEFNQYIISEQEMNDDNEPHLQYAIRESTLYFLSDLARNAFVDKVTKLDAKAIKGSDWYFNEYEQDASIQSMIAALETINRFFESHIINDYSALGNFVLDKLCVLYYDMETRYRGEETYVVINTTGEPLTATENIKPILLGNLSKELSDEQIKMYSKQWEQREDWFWKNRGDDKTADDGMNKFFEWYWQIGLFRESRWVNGKKFALNARDLFLNEPKEMADNETELHFNKENYIVFKSLENLNKYYQAITVLVDKITQSPEIQKILLTTAKKKDTLLQTTAQVWNWLREADLDIVLPLIVFVAKYGDDLNMLCHFTRRLRKNHYDSVWGKDNDTTSRRGKNYMDWRYLIQIINQIPTAKELFTADIYTLKIQRIPNLNLPVWFNDDERAKTKLSSAISIKELDEMEDNEFLMGDITPLWYNEVTKEYYSSDVVLKRWNILKQICMSFDSKEANKNIQFSNWFRLYRLASDLISIQHIYYCQSTFEGCSYSLKPDSPFWIETEQIENLMKTSNSIEFMKKYIKEHFNSFIRTPSDHKELLKGWLTIKTLQMEERGELLSYWNDRSISAYINMKDNYIVPTEVFHWGNVICGYSYSDNYSVRPAQEKSYWEQRYCLDSPITSIDYIPNYYKRAKDVIDTVTIENGDREVQNVIEHFFGISGM